MEKKICSRCKEIKLFPYFSNHAGNPDGKQSWCKLCVSKRDKAARAAKTKKKTDAIYYQKNKKTLRAKQNARNKKIREGKLTRSFLPAVGDNTKRCGKCGTPKKLSEFSKDYSKVDGHQGWCKECQKKAHRDKAARNRLMEKPTLAPVSKTKEKKLYKVIKKRTKKLLGFVWSDTTVETKELL